MKPEPTTELPLTNSSDASEESALIERILAGDKEAFYDLIRPCERGVFMTAFSVLQNSADAEEVAQEAILKAFRSLSSFRRASRFSTWLLKITLNEARMRMRKQHRELWQAVDEQEAEVDSDYEPEEFGDWREIPSEALERKEIRECLEKALGSLPEIYREVLFLRDIRQLSVAETAEVLSVSEGAVKTRLTRARFQLRDRVAPLTTTRGLFSRNLFSRGRTPWF